MSDFVEFQKIARLSRDVIVTEKIDGTNAHVYVMGREEMIALPLNASAYVAGPHDVNGADHWIIAGSRTRYINPEQDNHGFARWAHDHAVELVTLGQGRHYGEWWGSGIQRGYGLQKGEKRFSLFNVSRWALHGTEPQPIKTQDPRIVKTQDVLPPCVGLVPVLYCGSFDSFMSHSEDVIEHLRVGGSQASPGFMNPEGIVVFHTAQGMLFKKTLEKDAEPKSMAAPR